MAKKETTSTTTTGVAKLIKVRHRYNSSSGYSSGGGEDLDDEEAVNSYHYISDSSSSSSPSAMKVWLNRAEIFLWVASALFIFYLGDFQSNFFTVILRDPRIKRVALNIGLICLVSNIGICLFLGHKVKDVPRIDDKWEILAPCVLPVATVLGLLSFFLFSLALWPIWSFLTLPLLVTLFMAFVVVSPYILPDRKEKADTDLLRVD